MGEDQGVSGEEQGLELKQINLLKKAKHSRVQRLAGEGDWRVSLILR